MKTLTQLDKWNKDIEQLTDMAENASSAKLFKYYRGALIDIKKQMKAYIDDYDSLSFAKRLEADRLISVGAQMDKTLKETYGNAKGEIVGHSTISAENGYYGTWYALEGNENVQLDMAFLDKKYIHQLIYKEVAGATFSTRLYKERDKLAAATKQALLDATRDGKGYGHAAKAVEEATEASYKQALRIMRTEGGRARSEATQKSYVNAEKNGVTLEKQWIATLDKKTRRAHGELDGQRVPVKGKFKMDGHSADGPRLFKYPALDINCRCSTISVVNGIAPEVRRTKDGEIPFQSYNDWAESKGIKLAPKSNVVDLKISNPIFDKKRPRRSDYDDYDDLTAARKSYHELQAKRKAWLDSESNRFYNARVKNVGNAKDIISNIEKLGFPTKDLDKLDPVTLDAINRSIKAVNDKYPGFVKYLNDKKTSINAIDGNDRMLMGYNSVKIDVNTKFYGNKQNVIDSIREYIDSSTSIKGENWHANADAFTASMVHELGHAFEDYLKSGGKNPWTNIVDAYGASTLKELPFVSEYGATEKAEWFAEIFSQSLVGESTDYTTKFLKLVDDMLKGR